MLGRSPAGPLMTEHRVIERMIGVLERALPSIRATQSVDPELIDTATDFIRTYADRCHHGKEEDILFSRLADKPLTDELSLMMNRLIQDHVRGRALTRQLIDANARYRAGDPDGIAEIGRLVGDLVEFYPEHIRVEDRVFFKPCLEYFSREEKDEMLAEFAEFDRSLIHEKYRAVVEHLERQAP